MFQTFYKNKKVFVTGQTGFKGAWLCLWLKELGASVTAYALPPENSRGNLYESLNLNSKITSIYGDIRDYDNLANAIERSEPEIVFHLAAQPLVRASYNDPIFNYQSNVMGVVNLLSALRQQNNLKAVVNVTTDKCYENKEWVYPYRENDALGGHDPYSASKACAEIVTSSFRRSFFHNTKVGIATARAGNVIGGGDFSEDRIIPDLVEAILQDKELTIRSPHSVRPWQHVLDALYGYLILGMKLYGSHKEYDGAYNFSPIFDKHITVQELTDKFIKFFGQGRYRLDASAANLHESKLLQLDSSKARSVLGWKNLFDSEDTIVKTVGWYKDFSQSESKAVQITTQQIQDYMLKI